MALLLFYFLTLAGIICCQEETLFTVMRVKEDEDVILPCSLDSTYNGSETFDWRKDYHMEVFQYSAGFHSNNSRPSQDPQFKGRVFHFEDQLQSGNASIVIRRTKVKDSGSYSCVFPHHHPKIRSTIELIVGLSPKPHVAIVYQRDDWALLECEVKGAFPKPTVEWLDSDNKTVPVEESWVTKSEHQYNIVLQVTVTKTGNYCCVSIQEKHRQQTKSKIFVYLHGDTEAEIMIPGSSTGWIVAVVVLIVLLCIAAVIIAVLCIKLKSKAKHEDGQQNRTEDPMISKTKKTDKVSILSSLL